MRIVLLSQWCYPEPGPRVHELADGLARRGHEVTLVTGFPSYPEGRFHAGYRPTLYRRDQYGQARVLRLPLFPHGGKSVIGRVLNYGSFMCSAAAIGSWLTGRVDCMYVFLPPPTSGLAAWVLSLARRAPFLVDVQDIWPESVVASGMLADGRAVRAISAVQSFLYRRAARITVPSPGYRRNLLAKGVAEEKLEIVPNWADESVYTPLVRDQELAARLGLQDSFNVLFAGNLGIVQGLETLVQAADVLRDVADVRFVFAGSGVEESRLRALVAEKGLDNVVFAGRFPQEQMARVCSIADVLLVHLKKDPLFTITIPSKTLAYLACGRPLLMAVEGDAADLVAAADAGLVCAGEDPGAMADAVMALRAMTSREREVMGRAGRDYFETHFTLDRVVGAYERLLDGIRRR